MRFVKVRILGRCGVTDVQNILYYGYNIGAVTPYTSVEIENLLLAVRAAWDNNVRPLLGEYRIDGVTGREINERQDERDSDAVLIGAATGTPSVTSTDSRAVCAIFNFQMSSLLLPSPTNRPRRSYLAVGPLISTHVGNDGLVLWTPVQVAQIAAAFIQNHVVGPTVWEPYRVGTVQAPLTPRVARVNGAALSLKASVRRSRLDR